MSVKSLVGFAHVSCAFHWGIVIGDDAGHVLPGVRNREVGIGQGGSRARHDEERVS